jgi:hypothetical protein
VTKIIWRWQDYRQKGGGMMAFIRQWAYRQLIKRDLGEEPWLLYKILIFMIFLLGIVIDFIR